MNIFGSKSGHLNNSKNFNIFFIFHKLLYLMIFQSSAAYLTLSTLINHQILQKKLEKMMKNHSIVTVT